IGAILTPQLADLAGGTASLPYASSLCGACYDVCPVKIRIPEVLLHLRGRVVAEKIGRADPERAGLETLAAIFADRNRYERAQRLGRVPRRSRIRAAAARLPGPLPAPVQARGL